MDVTNPAVEQSQYLTFLVAGEEYAVGILQAKEIIQYDTVTRVPKTPAWVRGVINLRAEGLDITPPASEPGTQPELRV
jgi:purine-binding chemotaxis protein CheW